MNDQVDARVAATRLAEAAGAPDTSREDLAPFVQALFDALERVQPDEGDTILAILAPAIGFAQPPAAEIVSYAAGTLIENGVPPGPVEEAVVSRLRAVIPGATRLLDAARSSLAYESDEELESALEAARHDFGPAMQDEATAWDHLDAMLAPAAAVFSMSPDARRRATQLADELTPLAEAHTTASWLKELIAVLDDEPFVALEPSTGLGIRGRMSGVADNGQLHILLMDVFPQRGLFKRRRVPESAAAVARGDGPLQTEETIIGAWNLYTAHALDSQSRLPDPSDQAMTQNWIWLEGTPVDIPRVDGERVILLGPPAYVREFGAQRRFPALKASLRVDERLGRDEVARRLQVLAATDATAE